MPNSILLFVFFLFYLILICIINLDYPLVSYLNFKKEFYNLLNQMVFQFNVSKNINAYNQLLFHKHQFFYILIALS